MNKRELELEQRETLLRLEESIIELNGKMELVMDKLGIVEITLEEEDHDNIGATSYEG